MTTAASPSSSAPAPTPAPASPESAAAHVPFFRTVLTLCAVGLLVVSQLFTVLPVLLPLAESWGTTPSAAGWTATAFGCGYASGFLFSGPLSDRFGRRLVMTVGLALTAAATAAVAAAPSLLAGCAIRAVQGLCAAAFAPSAFAYIAERIEPTRRLAAMTWLTSSFFTASVLGQVYAQFVADVAGWEPVFLGCAAALAGAVLLLRGVLEGDRARPTTSVGDAFRAMGRLLTVPSLVLHLLATVSVLCGFVALFTGLQVVGVPAAGAGSGTLSALRAAMLPAMVLVPLCARWLVRLSAAARVIGGQLLAGVMAGVMALLTLDGEIGVIGLGVLLFVFVFAVGVTAPGLVESVSAQAGPARGAAVALYTFVLFLGASAGPRLAVAANGSFAVVCVAVAVVYAAGALFAALGRCTAGSR
ncbi:MFS transporter [Streptomyces sp. TRM49041]|uniref:MFS transporter n=1 Tax=Streptomyces sp. TRM49041 TaxID=2603216 RepID=UPI001CA3A44E|nr:MFS transporter [Streptomyces sp. TRM49041]